MLNPKVGVFYVSFLPQFIPPGESVPVMTVLMTSIHVGLGLIWFAILILGARSISGALQQPQVLLWVDRVTGGLFIAFALRLALERAP